MFRSSPGTLVVTVRTNDGIYVACDSHLTGSVVAPPSDQAQKIFQCGSKAFIAISGTVVARAGIAQPDNTLAFVALDLGRLLDEISSRYFGDNSDLVQFVASQMYHPIADFWERYIAPSPESFLSAQQPTHTSICTLSGALAIQGRYQVFEIQIPFTKDGHVANPTVQYKHDKILGWGHVPDADGLDDSLTNRSGVIGFISALFRRSVELFPDAVGGPIDIGFLDANGARWLKRKDLIGPPVLY
jgi:hypothetical protein